MQSGFFIYVAHLTGFVKCANANFAFAKFKAFDIAPVSCAFRQTRPVKMAQTAHFVSHKNCGKVVYSKWLAQTLETARKGA